MTAYKTMDEAAAMKTPQSNEELAELIARFRTPPGFDWKPLRNDILTVLDKGCPAHRVEVEQMRALLETAADQLNTSECIYDLRLADEIRTLLGKKP